MRRAVKRKIICGLFLTFFVVGLISSFTVMARAEKVDDDYIRDLRGWDESDFRDIMDIELDDDYLAIKNDLKELWIKGSDRTNPKFVDVVQIDTYSAGTPLAPDDNRTFYEVRIEVRDSIASKVFIVLIGCRSHSSFFLAGINGRGMRIDHDLFTGRLANDTNYYEGHWKENTASIIGDMLYYHERIGMYIPTEWFQSNEKPEDEDWVIGLFTEHEDEIYGDVFPNIEEGAYLSMSWLGIFTPFNLVIFAVLALIVVGIVWYARKSALS